MNGPRYSRVEKRTPQVNARCERRSLTPASIRHILSTFWIASRAATFWSVVLHIAIVSVLALIVFADRPVRDVITIRAEFGREPTDLQPLDLDSIDIDLSSPPKPIDSLLTAVDVTTAGLSGSTEAAIGLPSFWNVNLPETVSRGSAKEKKNTGRRGKGSSAIEGSGDGQGSGSDPGKASFFGTEVKARSIAFVIDASGSMAGARFHRARIELANSLRALEANQRFFVVFYTDQTYPQFYPNSLISLIVAHRTNISDILSWMERSQTQGGTEPQQAVDISLGLKPDVLFLLSDGEIPPNTRDVVLRANCGTVVHTIALGSNAGGHILKQIATDNGGTHRFIGDGF
jgi:hypothetical protein